MYLDLPLDRVVPNPDQPRKHFDQEALDELAASIAHHGLLEPLIVRPDGDRHVIIAGERRWRAAHLADLPAVPVRVLDLDDVAAFRLSIAENVNRADMNPMEEADAFATLLDYGDTIEEVAAAFGKTTRYVRLRLDLRDLRPELDALVRSGQMRPAVAQQVSRCSKANQQSILFKWMRGDFANDNEAIHFAYALHQAEGQDGFFDVDEPGEEERARRGKARQITLGLLTRLERASEVVDALANLDVDTLADSFQGDADVYLARLEHLAGQITKARFNARQARVKAEVRDTARMNAESA